MLNVLSLRGQGYDGEIIIFSFKKAGRKAVKSPQQLSGGLTQICACGVGAQGAQWPLGWPGLFATSSHMGVNQRLSSASWKN